MKQHYTPRSGKDRRVTTPGPRRGLAERRRTPDRRKPDIPDYYF